MQLLGCQNPLPCAMLLPKIPWPHQETYSFFMEISLVDHLRRAGGKSLGCARRESTCFPEQATQGLWTRMSLGMKPSRAVVCLCMLMVWGSRWLQWVLYSVHTVSSFLHCITPITEKLLSFPSLLLNCKKQHSAFCKAVILGKRKSW